MGEGEPRRGPGQARARVAVPPPVDARVSEVRALMERGEWRPSTSRELAERWGLSRARVQDHAIEASRQLRALDREAAQAKVAALLEKAESAAAYSKTRAADLVRVAQTWMRLYGLDRPGAQGTGAESNGGREAWFEEETDGEG